MANLLIVDDSRLTRMKISNNFSETPHDITQAADGREALDLVQANPEKFDVIFSDIHMPEMNGIELVAEVRKLGIEIPIIVSTADSQTATNEKVTKAGATLVLRKPDLFNKETALTTLAQYAPVTDNA